jgi:hypothetical protein
VGRFAAGEIDLALLSPFEPPGLKGDADLVAGEHASLDVLGSAFVERARQSIEQSLPIHSPQRSGST